MEIYNCVDYDTKPRKSLKINFKPLKKRDTAAVFDFSTYSYASSRERHFFGAAKLSGSFTFKGFLIHLGAVLTEAGESAKKHTKLILISLLCAFLTVAAIFGAVKIFSYAESHTKPLSLEGIDIESAEIEYLNRLMSEFALDNFSEVSENGDIANLEYEAIKLDRPVTYQSYKVQKGDTISGIAKKFGLTNVSTLISVNDISNVRTLAAGQKIKIPSADGIVYTVKKSDSLALISKTNNIPVDTLIDVNDLESEVLSVGQVLFLPGAKLDQKTLSDAMGDQFILPIKAKFRMSSRFGPRLDPITGQHSNHKGNDYACPQGTPIYASKSGKVIFVGRTWLYGEHVIIDHGNGYQTLYAHMSKTLASKGTWVSQGTKIGLVGSTGYSTGPHLHFTVYKNGKPIDPDSVLK